MSTHVDTVLTPIPHPAVRRDPRQTSVLVYKRIEARKCRKILYGTTIFYGIYGMVLLVMSCLSPHPFIGLMFYWVGLWSYTLVEYLAHRWLFHYQFKDKPGIDHYLYKIFDSVHNGHHANPLDGDHISGRLKDLL